MYDRKVCYAKNLANFFRGLLNALTGGRNSLQMYVMIMKTVCYVSSLSYSCLKNNISPS